MNQPNDPMSETMRTTSEPSVVKEKVGQVQEKASEIADKAQQQAANLTDQAKAEAKSTLDSKKDVAAHELHTVAQALRQTGNTLRDQDESMFARYSNQIADRVEQASTYLDTHSVDDFVFEVENFARRKPEIFIGSAFTLGLLAARFLKSSAPTAFDTQRNLPMYPQDTAGIAYTSNRPYSTDYDDYNRVRTPTDDTRYNRIRS